VNRHNMQITRMGESAPSLTIWCADCLPLGSEQPRRMVFCTAETVDELFDFILTHDGFGLLGEIHDHLNGGERW
jgi:hypothetical protein